MSINPSSHYNPRMKKQTRSILSEIQSFLPKENKESIVESRANHIIESAINLMEQIAKNYTPEQAEELEKKFFSSIKYRNTSRFERTIRKIHINESNKDNE